MKAFGSKRIFNGCKVVQAGWGRRVKFQQLVKSHKHGRAVSVKDVSLEGQ